MTAADAIRMSKTIQQSQQDEENIGTSYSPAMICAIRGIVEVRKRRGSEERKKEKAGPGRARWFTANIYAGW